MTTSSSLKQPVDEASNKLYTGQIDKTPNRKWSFLSITLYCIWGWGFSSGDLRCVEYSIFAITTSFALTRSGSIFRVPYIAQIDLFKNYYE